MLRPSRTAMKLPSVVGTWTTATAGCSTSDIDHLIVAGWILMPAKFRHSTCAATQRSMPTDREYRCGAACPT